MNNSYLIAVFVSFTLLGACSDQKAASDKSNHATESVAGQQTTETLDEASKKAPKDTASNGSKVMSKPQNSTKTKVNATESANKLAGNKVIGLYQYMADAAIFTDCATGKRYPVASEADGLQLERTYLSLVEQVGQKIMVELHAEFAMRPAMEGDDEEHLIPLRLIKFVHKDSCD
ncbi:hypothetical protein [Kangiella sp. TOML190]|uniref:hypothetical protein n=1 Tax=Kangiella sp. TOML190 TaxID=2931351 RepID=UPI00203CA2AE|nr:hypothetical protein [Kangiella sp. TOML190]